MLRVLTEAFKGVASLVLVVDLASDDVHSLIVVLVYGLLFHLLSFGI